MIEQRFYQKFEFKPPPSAFGVIAKTRKAKEFEEKYGNFFTVAEVIKEGEEPHIIVSNRYGVQIEMEVKKNGDIHVNGELLFEGGWEDVNADS